MRAVTGVDLFGRCLRCGQRVESSCGCLRCAALALASPAISKAGTVKAPAPPVEYPFDGGGILPLGRTLP